MAFLGFYTKKRKLFVHICLTNELKVELLDTTDRHTESMRYLCSIVDTLSSCDKQFTVLCADLCAYCEWMDFFFRVKRRIQYTSFSLLPFRIPYMRECVRLCASDEQKVSVLHPKKVEFLFVFSLFSCVFVRSSIMTDN